MGTPDFAVPALEALIAAGHDIVAVYTRPPSAAGRGQRKRLSPVHRVAEDHGIEVHTPKGLKSREAATAWRDLDLDAAVVVAYGLILPKAFLEAPKLGCLNIHASLLPRWRGAAPIQRAILAGDPETGVTIMQMAEGLDAGPILMQRRTPITSETTAGDLHDRLAVMGAEAITECLPALADGDIVPRPQPADGITYAPKIDKTETRIDWARPAAEIDCLVRAMAPAPGAWFLLNDTRIKVRRGAPVLMARYAAPGTVIDCTDEFTIACGEGAYRLIEVQREGRAPMLSDAFLRGVALSPGEVLD